jgi:hypothetical protein
LATVRTGSPSWSTALAVKRETRGLQPDKINPNATVEENDKKRWDVEQIVITANERE